LSVRRGSTPPGWCSLRAPAAQSTRGTCCARPRRQSKRAGLDGVGVHTLRHSAATLWLESGVHIKQVADLLRHSSISITGDIYGHGTDDAARAAVEALDVALRR
jgi:integrase